MSAKRTYEKPALADLVTTEDVIAMLEREAREVLALGKTESARMRRKNSSVATVHTMIAAAHFAAANLFGLAENLRSKRTRIRTEPRPTKRKGP